MLKPSDIERSDIIELLKKGVVVKSVKGNVNYTIKDISQSKIILAGDGIEYKDITFNKIVEYYKNQKWQHSVYSGNNRGAAALAKYLFENISNVPVQIESSDQFRLIQFHPSYTYEDFVRGILAEPTEDGLQVSFKAKNKLLGNFAQSALDNFIDSKKEPEEIGEQEWVREIIRVFEDHLDEKLVKNEKIMITDVAYITRLSNRTIRYQGDNWKIDGGVPYHDLELMFLADCLTLQDIKELSSLTLSAKSNPTYWLKVLELFKSFILVNKDALPQKVTFRHGKIVLKNYVLVIDEINRANLSSVLGELIYALEYRDEIVNSMYEVDGKTELILPSNLFIIGTMNTADRSVGSIDYAIRRRFAFLEILPKDLTSEDGLEFYSDLFADVSELFVENYLEYKMDQTIELKRSKTMSLEFRPEDVWLGHSYFMGKQGATMSSRCEFEIIPILKEYIKDGILEETAIEKINAITFKYVN